MVMYAKIRRMYFREHLTIHETKRRTSLSRNTIKKWLKEAKAPQYQRRQRRWQANAICAPTEAGPGNGCAPPQA